MLNEARLKIRNRNSRRERSVSYFFLNADFGEEDLVDGRAVRIV